MMSSWGKGSGQGCSRVIVHFVSLVLMIFFIYKTKGKGTKNEDQTFN